MASGELAHQHAESQADNVRSNSLPLISGEEIDANGSDSAETSAIKAEAGPSRPRFAGSGRSVSSSLHDATSKAPPKRKRLNAELAFSSPGPAFQLQEQEAEVQDDTNGGNGRARRPRRSAAMAVNGVKNALTNGNGSDSGFRRSRPSDLAPEESESGDPPIKLNADKAKARNEVAQRRSSTTSDQPDRRSRSRSKSTVKTESDRDSASDQDREGSLTPTLAVTRPKPQITPVAALDPQAPLPEILERRRKEKIALAQSELEDVHDGHDMLVRELFHLTKFVTMVGYDPEVARIDQSDVFTTFKHAHDLRFSLDQSGSGSNANIPGRVTRRRVNARLESLSLKRSQPPSTPSTPMASKFKVDGKNRGADSTRGRRFSSMVESRSDVSAGRQSDSESDQDEDHTSDGDSDVLDITAEPRGTGRGKARAADTRRRSPIKQARSQKRQRSVVEGTSSGAPTKRTGPRKSKVLDELDAFILRHRPRPLPDHPPPLHILASHQVPAPRRFGGNVYALWESFDLLHEGEDAHGEDLDLPTYLKLDERSRAGLPIHPEAGSTTRYVAHRTPRTKSHHDHLLETIASSYTQMRQYAKLKQQGSRKVARMVAQHWERQLGTSEREKKAEEKRIRALAKWTLREVLKQWRLAVNVIRAKKAAAEKAEKEKSDKEQLNAILEQSTAMLKKQREVMIRVDRLEDSGDESDGTSYGSWGTVEADRSDIEDESRDATPEPGEIEEAEELESVRDPSAPVSRGQSTRSTPVVDVMNDPTPSAHDGAASDAKSDSPTPATSEAIPSRRSRRSVRSVVGDGIKAKDSKLDPDDVEFDLGADDGEQEDAELERQMWEEDEEDDSEDAGLEADANMPIEELLKRYGYGQEEDQEAEFKNAEREAASEDGQEHSSQAEEERLEEDATDASIIVEAADKAAEQQAKTVAASDNEIHIDERPSSAALIRPTDTVYDDQSDTESAATSGRRSRRSMTRASSVMSSSDRPSTRSRQPFLLRGQLRPYQQIGFEWLASLYANSVNGILADEMGLGKTIQTISLLAHLACDKGVWGPHLVVAPTSVMLNWEVEFKKFLPGFKVLSYYGSQKERKEKRVGWNTENSFNVCITSYQLVLADQHIFRRKPWVYLVLDEAHHIKNFRSQRWQTLLGFNSQRRLLLTGTPLQNNLMDLWSLMYFLMPNGVGELHGGGAFANMKDFQDWFSNPLDKAIEAGSSMSSETRAMVQKLHAVLRPYLLRRLKSEVEKELPSKYEHVITCKLSKRQRFLYNDFMSRAKTRESLASGNYLSIINCLMQLRKVCNHPDLFEVRPIVTSFAMSRSVAADFEIKELLVRRQLLREDIWDKVDLDMTNFRITNREEHLTAIESRDLRRLNASKKLPDFKESVPENVELDMWTIDGFEKTREQRKKVDDMEKWKHLAYVNQYRCTKRPIYGPGLIKLLRAAGEASHLKPLDQLEHDRKGHLNRCDSLLKIIKSRQTRLEQMQPTIDRFAFVTPRAVATDLCQFALPEISPSSHADLVQPEFDTIHPVAVKLHIAFPDASLLQYDCGKLQQLDILMRRLKAGGHRILIFTQMTRVLDILESFLNYHGYRYLRLDGATKVESRQALTEKFNRDLRISAFILSTRSGGLGINLTGADTVLFYDLDWNAAIEAQCMDRAHRIGQTRDVHIYRFVTEHTIEENMLRKANQKRLLDNVVIQEGEFNTEAMMRRGNIDWRDMLDDGGKLGDVEVGMEDEKEAQGATGRDVERAFLEAEDEEDRIAALKAREEMFDDDDEADFDDQQVGKGTSDTPIQTQDQTSRLDQVQIDAQEQHPVPQDGDQDQDQDQDEGGNIDDYMLNFVQRDWDFFA
ncbi:related to SWR1 - DEAH-box protein, putative RNA helicase [Melanopsichium pennsylvanicum]|uniref:Helicase SWR1 n=2 Tax=Melanopsichium pennsylvanicum TaxID=63383 RepID=A0AAJ4XRT7_9BASI|nr:related to SWR1-DEAH-box protein, putative RNA helicase [Melanopsichium pennsylvanicum 4]SNX86697.1 related to SWR1 - DEAH-box protein, putative RNA helicase [Melanopsichium pennsylvanicum]